MATITNVTDPKINIEIQGRRVITDMYKTYQFPVDEKLETKIKLNVNSGTKSIYLDSVYPVRMIIVDAPVQDDDVDIYSTSLIITTLGIGASSGVETDQIIDVHGFNCLRFPKSFGERITDIKLVTDSLDDISIDVRMYSKTSV